MKFTFLFLTLFLSHITACQLDTGKNKTELTASLSSRIKVEKSPLFDNYTNDKIEVANFLEDYFNLMYDSSRTHRNSFWNSDILTAQQDRFLRESLSKKAHIVHPPKIYGIRATEENEFIVTIALAQKDFPFKVMELKVAKDGLGRFYFIDLFSENLNQFTSYKSQENTYLYSPTVKRNKTLERESDRFNLKMSAFAGENPLPIKTVVLKNLREYCDVMGYIYSPMLTYDGQTGGLAIPEENIIISANDSPYYPHEIVHLYTNKFKAHRWFDEGLATYLGGSVEHPLEYHLQKIAAQMDSLDFSAIPENKKLDDDTNFQYALGGLFCKLAMESKTGKQAVLTLLNAGNTDDDFHSALYEVFGIKKVDYNVFLRKQLTQYLNPEALQNQNE